MTDRAIWPDPCRPVRIRAVDDIDHITNFWDTTTEDDLFGGRVSMSEDGTTALIGDFRHKDPNGPAAGSAYVFSRGDQQEPAPGDGSEADLDLSAEASGTVQPGETLTVTAELMNQNAPNPISGLININPPQKESDPLAVTADTTNPAFLGPPGGTQLPAVADSVTREFELTVAEDAALGQQLALQAEAVLQTDTDEFDTTATQTVTVTEQQTPVNRFDDNGEPGIQGNEVLDVISEFNEGGDVEATDVLDVISAFNGNQRAETPNLKRPFTGPRERAAGRAQQGEECESGPKINGRRPVAEGTRTRANISATTFLNSMQKEFRPSWAGWFWPILLTFGFAIPYVWWRRRGVRYEITDSRVIRHTGRLSSSIDEFRLDKGMAATRITTNQSLSEKVFGAGSITIEAGADEMTLKSVPNYKRIAKQIRELQD